MTEYDPIFSNFPNAIALLPAVLLYLFDGLSMYTRSPLAHARGLTIRRLSIRAAEGVSRFDPGWFASRDRLGLRSLSDGSWSTWSPVGYGAAYNGVFWGMSTSKKCVGVVMTTIIDPTGDGDLDVSSHLRVGPMLIASILPLCFMQTTLPLTGLWRWLPFAIASLLGPGIYTWSYRRNARHVSALIEELRRHLGGQDLT